MCLEDGHQTIKLFNQMLELNVPTATKIYPNLVVITQGLKWGQHCKIAQLSSVKEVNKKLWTTHKAGWWGQCPFHESW